MPYIKDSSFIKRWTTFYGKEQVKNIQKWNRTGINEVIRVNTLITTSNKLLRRLKKKDIELKPAFLPNAFQVHSSPLTIGSTHEFLEGQYTIQGLASQFVSHLLDMKTNDINNQVLLDMTAAPGGKTAHLASLMDNKGVIVAIESSKNRLASLRSNLSRLHVKNTVVLHGRAEQVLPQFLKKKKDLFDKIILDAPCTGSGSICRNPNLAWTRTVADIDRLKIIQTILLNSALKALKKDGELIYSTCSLEPEEGELQIQTLLEKRSNIVELAKIEKDKHWLNGEQFQRTRILKGQDPFEIESKCLRLLPSELHEGFFIAKLKKIA